MIRCRFSFTFKESNELPRVAIVTAKKYTHGKKRNVGRNCRQPDVEGSFMTSTAETR